MAPLQQMVMQPSPLGELFVSAADIAGINPYAPGGVAVSPQAFALQSFKTALGACSQSGNYFVLARSIAGPGGASIKLQWFVAATGAEAGAIDLSAEIVRIVAIGN
jgi:hypothetical protein